MHWITTALIVVVILLHVYFLILELFLWDTPRGRKVFSLSKDFARQAKNLAANQGLYNGFLAAGLVWGLLSATHGASISLFFLLCVTIAGIFGAMTVNRKIFFVQAAPAILGIAALLLLE